MMLKLLVFAGMVLCGGLLGWNLSEGDFENAVPYGLAAVVGLAFLWGRRGERG